MKTFTAEFRFRDKYGLQKDIQSNSLKDAKVTAKRIAEQEGYWLMNVVQIIPKERNSG